MGGYTTISITGIEGLSGVCLAPDGSGLLAASDRRGVYRVSFSGETEPLYVEPQTQTSWLDCEGVTVDPATGDVYFVVERKQEVRRLRAPGYGEAELLTTITDGSGNSGLEAITWMGDGTLLIGNQANPCLLIRYSVTDGTILGKTEITAGITDISDLCYDPVRNALWIADSETRTINLCDLDGRIQKSYSVSFIDNGEGLCIDRERQCIWACDDTTSQIYKISFSDL